MSLQPAGKQKKCDPEMVAASTLEERPLRKRQGACLGQVALLANREENANRGKKSGGLVAVNFDNKKW